MQNEEIQLRLSVVDEANVIFNQKREICAGLRLKVDKSANGIVAVVNFVQPREKFFRLRFERKNLFLRFVGLQFQPSCQKFLTFGKQKTSDILVEGNFPFKAVSFISYINVVGCKSYAKRLAFHYEVR